jgi:hypothetical protein
MMQYFLIYQLREQDFRFIDMYQNTATCSTNQLTPFPVSNQMLISRSAVSRFSD